MIDGGNLTDILFLGTFKNIGRSKNDLKLVEFTLIGFAGRTTYPLMAITLSVIVGEGWKIIDVSVTFIVVDVRVSYSAILRRTTINPNKIGVSTIHQKMKFLTRNDIGEVLDD